MSINIELNSAPSSLSLYWRVLTARKKGKIDSSQGLLGEARLNKVQCDPVRLANYRRTCGFSDDGYIPTSYPFVLGMPLQLSLLASDAFPFRVLGIVHVSNQITQYRPITADELLDFHCTLSGPREANRGWEFDLHTQVTVQGTVVWESVCTMLRRDRASQRKPRKRAEKATEFTPETISQWPVPADTGRRYAGVSGDRNPIHLYAFTAKLFGFPRAIAHGMWTKARCLAELQAITAGAPLDGRFSISAEFKRPLLLPAKARFERAGNEFRVTTGGGRRVHLTGTLEAV